MELIHMKCILKADFQYFYLWKNYPKNVAYPPKKRGKNLKKCRLNSFLLNDVTKKNQAEHDPK